jgi:hypothetical protein
MPTDVIKYHLKELLLCEHYCLMAQARLVESAPTEVQQEELAKVYGIKGVPLLSALRSLSFPPSFLFNFMHLV